LNTFLETSQFASQTVVTAAAQAVIK